MSDIQYIIDELISLYLISIDKDLKNLKNIKKYEEALINI